MAFVWVWKYRYTLFRYRYYLTYIFVCLRLYWNPFLSVSKSTTTHLLSSAGPTGFLVPLSFRFGGWRGGLGRSRLGCPTWLRCLRLVFPPKVDSPPMMPFKKDNRFKIEHLDPLCQSIHWQGDPDDWHPGREEQKLHQICPFWHLSFFLFVFMHSQYTPWIRFHS